MLSDFPLGKPRLLTPHHPVDSGLTQVQLVPLQPQVFRQQVRVAQTLDHGVHETGVPVVFQPQDTWDFLSVVVQEFFSARAQRGGRAGSVLHHPLPGHLYVLSDDPRAGAQGARCAIPKPPVVVLRVMRVSVSKVGESAQSFDDSVHKAPNRLQRFLSEELPRFGLLLFALLLLRCRHFLLDSALFLHDSASTPSTVYSHTDNCVNSDAGVSLLCQCPLSG